MKKKVNTDTKLAGKGIRYDLNFVAPDDDFKDLTNPDVRLNDLKNVHASPSRITRSQGKLVVLRNITPTILEKIILQLPDFKPMDAVVHSVDLPSTSKQKCSQSSSDNELELLRSDVKMLTEKVSSMKKFMKSSFELIFRALDIKNDPKVGTSIGDNDGDNSNKKDDETPNVTGKATDCVGSDVIGHLVDAAGEKVNFVGDCVDGHVDVDSAAETCKDGAWKNFSNFNFLKFTQSSGENKDIREGINSQVDSDWSNFIDFEVSKFTQPFHDQKTQKEGDVAVLSQNDLDGSEIPDTEISKFTQPDKSVAITGATDLVRDNVRKVDITASDNVKGIEENMVSASAMLDETPVIPRRLRKPAAVCESLFLSKFDFGYGKVEGQSSKSVENTQPSKRVLSIKHPFVKSIMERIDDMKVTLKFNRFVARSLCVKQMDCGVFVAAFAEYFLDGLEISNHLDDIDAIRIRYGMLLWDYEKKK
ncbi:hypothetical protein FXO38_10097 [Capsicum annuum]|nr:hypothetical protein FXO38_10097 [Capsicum annuum]